MTHSAPPPPAPPAPRPSRRPADGPLQSSSLRTVQALLGSGLGIVPLRQMFSDAGWIFDAWLTMIIVIGPAALLRLRARPSALHLWPGLALAVAWLTSRFVSAHAILGFVPGPGAWHDVSTLLTQLHQTITDGVAPVHTSPAVRLVVCASVGVLAALVDLIAVVARRGALAGVPLLIIYTVSGAVPRHPVGWLLFACGAAGFLLLLGLDANDDLRSWGRFMPRAGVTRPVASLGVSGQRIALAAIAVAVVLPLIAPSTPTNLIANAFHHNTGAGTGGSKGFGANNIALDPFASLRGTLNKPKATALFKVTLDSSPANGPVGYLRANVLEHYTAKGWSAADHGSTVPLSDSYPVLPPDLDAIQEDNFGAQVTVEALHDTPPTFGRPSVLDGLSNSCGWTPQDQILINCTIKKGDQYTEQVLQPDPTRAELQAAPDGYGAQYAQWLQVPGMPTQVSSLVTRLTGTISSPYGRALALQNYFTNPANGFSYSLRTKTGDSGSDLVDFLNNKEGFCQQYAAAMAVMLRMAKVPTRVVLGYTHPVPDASKSFTVTTNDAHAWVEAYFIGVGWVPFDPTPLAGIDGGAAADFPWATHATAAASSGAPESSINPHQLSTGAHVGASSSSASVATTATSAHHVNLMPVIWTVLLLVAVVALLLIPAGARTLRRRRRLAAARQGDPDPLWVELSATAVDLGYVWSPARSPRQVVGWIDRQAGPASAALTQLASAVEAARYARPGEANPAPELVLALQETEARLRAGRRRSTRLRSRLVPASLGWRWLRLPGVRLPSIGRGRRQR